MTSAVSMIQGTNVFISFTLFDRVLSVSVSLKSDHITYVEMSYVLSLFSQALAGCFSDE